MKINSVGLTTVVFILSAIYYGCVVVENRTFFDPAAVAAITALDRSLPETSRAKLNKVTVEVDAGKCQASFETDPNDGRLKAKTTKILPGSDPGCRIEEPPDKLTDLLTINTKSGPKALKSISAVQFTYQGSCRYCWANTNGGMTCVFSPFSCP